MGEGGNGQFNTRIAAPEYRKAFAARGWDLMTLDPGEAAKRIAASAVRADLVAALDDWALHEPEPVLQNRLLEVARRAEPAPWTDALRSPAVRNDKSEVEKLAVDADPAGTSPRALGVLARLMMRHGLDPVPLLATVRAKHPADFELALLLGLWHTGNSKRRTRARSPNPTHHRHRGSGSGTKRAKRSARTRPPVRCGRSCTPSGSTWARRYVRHGRPAGGHRRGQTGHSA